MVLHCFIIISRELSLNADNPNMSDNRTIRPHKFSFAMKKTPSFLCTNKGSNSDPQIMRQLLCPLSQRLPVKQAMISLQEMAIAKKGEVSVLVYFPFHKVIWNVFKNTFSIELLK